MYELALRYAPSFSISNHHSNHSSSLQRCLPIDPKVRTPWPYCAPSRRMYVHWRWQLLRDFIEEFSSFVFCTCVGSARAEQSQVSGTMIIKPLPNIHMGIHMHTRIHVHTYNVCFTYICTHYYTDLFLVTLF